jgi:hypothetical protein
MQLGFLQHIFLKLNDPENTFFDFVFILFPVGLLADFFLVAKVFHTELVEVSDQNHICHAHYSKSRIDKSTGEALKNLFGIGLYNLR